MKERGRPRGLQLPLCQPLCCTLAKQEANGHTTVKLPLVVPLHPLLSGSAGWPWRCLEMHSWRCTTVSVPDMVRLSVWVKTVPYQRWQWWCFYSVGNHGYFNQEHNSACMAATSVLCFLPSSQAGCPPLTPWDHDLELHIQSPFMPSSANKTRVEIHWQAASMTLNSKYKSRLLPLCLSLSLCY